MILEMSNEIQLSLKLTLQVYEDFTFFVNGVNYKTTKIVADLLSQPLNFCKELLSVHKSKFDFEFSEYFMWFSAHSVNNIIENMKRSKTACINRKNNRNYFIFFAMIFCHLPPHMSKFKYLLYNSLNFIINRFHI